MALQRGKKAVETELELSVIREIEREELALLEETRPHSPLQNLRDHHHRIARAVATGLRAQEIASLCGISIGRLGVLKLDPAFADLVAHYRGIVTAEFVRSTDHYLEMATGNMLKAEAMLSDKLDAAAENNEFLPTRDLISISRDAADRFGYGKRQMNLNVNIDFAAQLEAARNRSNQARNVSPSLAPNMHGGDQVQSLGPTRSEPGPQRKSVDAYPIAEPSSRTLQQALTIEHSPHPSSAPPQFRRRV